jgi:hypothetical protein
MQTHKGSCHCGKVRYEVEADLTRGGTRCNCTVCTKLSVMGGLVKPSAFKLVAGEESLSYYEWGMRVAKRFFCKHCGTHCYGKGHLDVLGGDFVSVNYNTLDDADPAMLKVAYWDGCHDNWQAGTRDQAWPINAA